MTEIFARNLKIGDTWRYNPRCIMYTVIAGPFRKKGIYSGWYRRKAETGFIMLGPRGERSFMNFPVKSKVQRL